jgi:Hypothetical glycosyl hydrolase 6/Beta-galactosidase trimerisation domain
MSKTIVKPMRFRQVHLDFHTSEHIDGLGAGFDPSTFVSTLQAANVDSITIFAKCHHGWSYYPTKVGTPHPGLARPDMMGEMVDALNAANIECPIYISVQWDELMAREHPEWRVMGVSNRFHRDSPDDTSTGKQLSPAWHTLCLNHEGVRNYVRDQALEVARNYKTPGLFFDIVLTPDCVCPSCLKRMRLNGLDPTKHEDRLKNDEAVNEQFRQEVTTALHAEFPDLRVFYNCGHIHKQGRERFSAYTHLELESLPTGGWGYDHFPSSARYAATLGMDFVSHTGKFHTSWGEFGGFKHPDALEYECAQMVSLGSKCLVGDQLHPNGVMNPDTYASIAPGYARIKALEPYLIDARQVSQVAILSAEHMNPQGDRNAPSDDGAAQMLLELKWPFDVIDLSARFEDYRLVILPDTIPVNAVLAARLNAFLANGGKLIASWHSGLDEAGAFALDFGIERTGGVVEYMPSYIKASKALDASMPETAFVSYETADVIKPAGAEVLADIYPSYFNRTFDHFCSHQHAPDDCGAAALGAAVTVHKGSAYIAYPIFRLYRAMGQPLYKYIVRGLLERLIPDPVLKTDLPSSGRASLSCQKDANRHILHLLYGPPQIRGKEVPGESGGMRVMEMIEDIPAIGPVTAQVRLASPPARVFDAITQEDIAWTQEADGMFSVTLPRLRIHCAVVFEGTQ